MRVDADGLGFGLIAALAPEAEAWIVGQVTSKATTHFYDGVTPELK